MMGIEKTSFFSSLSIPLSKRNFLLEKISFITTTRSEDFALSDGEKRIIKCLRDGFVNGCHNFPGLNIHLRIEIETK